MAVHSRFLKMVPALAAALLAACSETTNPVPPEFSQVANRDKIPEKVFQVNISRAQNDCHITDTSSFSFLALPEHAVGNSYKLFLLLDSAVSAKLTGFRLTFSVPIVLDNGVVTLAADWTFSKDRQGFSGATTFDVHANNGNRCLFTYATDGKLAVVPTGVITPPPTGQATASAVLNSATIIVDPESFSWGWAVPVGGGNLGVFDCTTPHVINGVEPPITVRARNTNSSVYERDWVSWRYRVYYEPTPDLESQHASDEQNGRVFDPERAVVTSDWYTVNVDEYGNLTGLPYGADARGPDRLRVWRGNALSIEGVLWAQGNTFLQSIFAQFVPLTRAGFYFPVFDLYWWPRPGQLVGYYTDRPSQGWEQGVQRNRFCQ